jgi:hypothetical protein
MLLSIIYAAAIVVVGNGLRSAIGGRIVAVGVLSLLLARLLLLLGLVVYLLARTAVALVLVILSWAGLLLLRLLRLGLLIGSFASLTPSLTLILALTLTLTLPLSLVLISLPLISLPLLLICL